MGSLEHRLFIRNPKFDLKLRLENKILWFLPLLKPYLFYRECFYIHDIVLRGITFCNNRITFLFSSALQTVSKEIDILIRASLGFYLFFSSVILHISDFLINPAFFPFFPLCFGINEAQECRSINSWAILSSPL